MSTPTETAAPAAPITESTAAPETENKESNEQIESSAAETAEETESSDKEDSTKKPIDKKAVETPSAKKKFKLKVDGKELEEELDLSNEEEIVRNLQLAKAAQKRMAEHAQLKKEIENFFEAIQNDPEAMLAQLGIDPEEFSVKTLQKKIDDQQKSPEQREKEKIEKELKDLRDKIKKDDDERKASELSRLQAEQEKQIEEGVIGALEKHSLPNKPLVVKRMAEVMLTALENNLDLSPMDVAPIVKKELESDMKEYIGALPDEAIEALLGKERLVGMRKKQVAAIKKAAETANSIKPTGNEVKAKQEAKQSSKKLSFSDFLK